MSDYKAGLHKDVSEIFNGVSLPEDNSRQKSSALPGQGSRDYNAPKPPVPSHMTPTKPKPEQSPPKAAEVKQPKAGTAIKTGEPKAWQRSLERIKSKLFPEKPGVNSGRQKTMVILAPILFIVLIFMFVRTFSSPSQKVKGTGKSASLNASAADSKTKLDWQVPQPYPATLRDPMQFGSAAPRTSQAEGETSTAGLIIKGIVYSKDSPCAVIGDRIVHEGDKVLDVVIVKINENSVEFEANGKKWEQKVQR
ncbi:MAG: hypothetical protein WC476_08590 [Phycisphaerae bacterium]|jgi:hypothetical protein